MSRFFPVWLPIPGDPWYCLGTGSGLTQVPPLDLSVKFVSVPLSGKSAQTRDLRQDSGAVMQVGYSGALTKRLFLKATTEIVIPSQKYY